MFTGQSIQVRRIDSGFAELCFDRQGEAINKFDKRTVAELKQAVTVLAQASDLLPIQREHDPDVLLHAWGDVSGRFGEGRHTVMQFVRFREFPNLRLRKPEEA